MNKENKRQRKHVIRTILLVLAAGILIAGIIFSHFGGFGTGPCADTNEFSKYSAPISEITIPEDTRIIALGEATHGNAEFQQLKLDVFKLMVDGEVVEIRLDDLLYVESMGHTLYYHLPDRQYSVYSSLSRAEEELSQRGFLRIHKSYLVNMGHLRRFSVKEALLDNGQVLPVSEKNYAALKRQFLLWKGMS